LTGADIATGAVNGATVGDGSLTGADIAAGAVDGAKVRDGSLTGADIAGKVPAAVTADMLASVQRIAVPATSEAVAADATTLTSKAVTATCPSGTFVVGGGANLGDQDAQSVNDSYPSSTTAWTATVFNGAATAPGFTVYAMCVPAAAAS
jgi:hypothetical protein